MTQQQDRQHSDQSDENNALLCAALERAEATMQMVEISTERFCRAVERLDRLYDVPWEELGERDDTS